VLLRTFAMRNIYTEDTEYKVKAKEITIRVGLEEWLRLDDKRHESRETWQSIGLKLFRKWMESETKTEGSVLRSEGAREYSSSTPADKMLFSLLERILSSGHPKRVDAAKLALRALDELTAPSGVVEDADSSDVQDFTLENATLDDDDNGNSPADDKARREAAGKHGPRRKNAS
jgi:hypothetical protein